MENTKRIRDACLVIEALVRVSLLSLAIRALFVECSLNTILAFVLSLTTLAIRVFEKAVRTDSLQFLCFPRRCPT
jgi:hypothetical protein